MQRNVKVKETDVYSLIATARNFLLNDRDFSETARVLNFAMEVFLKEQAKKNERCVCPFRHGLRYF